MDRGGIRTQVNRGEKARKVPQHQPETHVTVPFIGRSNWVEKQQFIGIHHPSHSTEKTQKTTATAQYWAETSTPHRMSNALAKP